MMDWNSLVEDRNGDGVPDYVNARIYVASEPAPEELAAAANIAARLAFDALSIDLPMGFRISRFRQSDPSIAIVIGSAVSALSDRDRAARRILEFADPADAERFALEVHASPGSGKQPRPERAPRRLSLDRLFTANGLLGDLDRDLIPDAVETTLVIGPDVHSTAIIDLAARIALETTGLCLPLAVSKANDANLPNATLIGRNNPHIRKLIEAGRVQTENLAPGEGLIEAIANAFGAHSALVLIGADAEGEDAAIRQMAHRLPYLWNYGKGAPTADAVLASAATPSSVKAQPARVLFEESHQLPWEIDDAEERLRLLVLPAIRPGDAVDLELRVSEPRPVRNQVARRTLQALLRSGADKDRTRVRILPAYKQGYGWIDEQLRPALHGASAIAITFQETPVEEGRVESEARWLQELYPIDEILARDLGIPTDRVTFHKAAPGSGPIYTVRAEGTDAETESSFSPAFVFQPMFDAFPDYATVRVTTGWLKAVVNGVIVADERIQTDAERFWDVYQRRILPGIRACGDAGDTVDRILEVDVMMSEPDDRIGIDEERIAPLDALHEDIYFETLMYFDLIGWKRAPRVVPRMLRLRRGGPSTLRVRLSERPRRAPAPAHSEITSMTVRAGKGPIALKALSADGTTRPFSVLTRRSSARTATSRRTIPWDKPIGPVECAAIVRRLGRLPEVRAYEAGRSYLGIPIWALDVMAPMDGAYVSQAKASVTKPALFVTGRQHGNEVSSTTHILRFVELLATDPAHRRLLDRINIVVQPIANPDGAALTSVLAKDVPGHILHAGYYGALGTDVTTDEWAETPPYPEARARRELWRTWLPDVVLNPHGYPSHEWVQLFAGYTAWVKSRATALRDWWIPRGWFTPRFTYVEDPAFPHHPETARALRDRLEAAALKRFHVEHERMAARHVKYAAWDASARALAGDNHGIGAKPAPKGPGFMLRHPEVTVLELVTEIPDEVAHGAWMRTTAETGLESSLEAARFLAESHFEVTRANVRYEDGTVLRIARKRPVRDVGPRNR